MVAPILLARARGIRYVLRDKGYDADAFRIMFRKAKIVPVIPGRNSRKRQVQYDKASCRKRHLIENANCRIKDFRRVATRYDELAINFLLDIALATIVAFWVTARLSPPA